MTLNINFDVVVIVLLYLFFVFKYLVVLFSTNIKLLLMLYPELAVVKKSMRQ